jgi:hypothetical protein
MKSERRKRKKMNRDVGNNERNRRRKILTEKERKKR